MRVNELAKELGRPNKEVLEILQKNNQDVKSHSSNVNEEQIGMVRRALSSQKPAVPEAKAPAAGAESRPAAPSGQESRPASAQSQEARPAAGAEAPKKKIAAVYRPQNSQQRPQGQARNGRGQGQNGGRPAAGGARPQGQVSVGVKPGAQAPAGRPSVQTPPQPIARLQRQAAESGQQEKAQTGGQQENRAGVQFTAQSAAKQKTSQTSQPAGTAQAQRPGAQQESGQQPGARPGGQQESRAGAQQAPVQQPGTRTGSQQPVQQPGVRAGAQQPAGQPGTRASFQQPDRQSGARPQGQQGAGAGRQQSDRQSFSGSRQNSGQGGRSGFQGNRDGRGSGQGYQGSRDGRSGGQGYQGNRDGRSGGPGYQGSRDGRSGGQGYQGNRDGRSGGPGFQGNRDGRSGGQGYQGNRDGRSGGPGYQGSRDGRSGGQGYQGNRDGRSGGPGYQGNRDGRPGQGFSGRPGQGGARPQAGGQGGFGGRGGARPGQGPAKSYDSPLQTKPGSTRSNKNNYKNDRYDKKNTNEDGPRSKGGKVSKHPFIMPQKSADQKIEETVKVIILPETLTIKDLADKMKLQPSVIIKKLFLQGQIVTMNSEIDFEKAEEIAMEYDVLCEKEEKVDVIAELLKEDAEDESDMIPRPPVVCVMGHVDHGKTSLLDAIRSTNVTSREAGGITQHIGAYTVEINDHQITFLDTPGHEAFTAMRLRGAQSTDIAILVVAADDGVMPQTVEAINHAKAAGVEIIVAINKIDKPSANVDRVKQELSEYELIPEDWGGSTIFVPVSAHTKDGIPELLEMILLAAEVRELKANPDRKARGLVIEAELDKGKGPVATILVQKGTLRVGDNVTAGPCYGKVRAMMDDKGRRVKEAGPSMPVEVLGLNDVPGAGDVLMAVDNEKEARSYAETFIAEGKNKLLEDTRSRLSLDDLFSQIKAGNVKELPIIVKADVQGSVEAVKQSLVKLSNEEVVVKVIHGGVGAINESDVTLASASNAIIIGFNVRPDVTAKSIAEREKVDVRLYRVIYQAIEDVEAAMKGMLDPVFEEQVIGHAVVRQTFKASGVGTIAGAYVMDGKFQRGCTCRLTRDGEQLFEGPLASLKRFKDDVKEVATGYECGLVFEKFNDIQEDDMVEAYIMVEVPR
ncbi:MAG: translation initiation factor IF-2 [Lachnospiraceae bacterium]|jgi:translation initiation factor IF-2|nr:translation initiation factor IF-2 [Lachnospiraceae bacterium]